MQGIRPVRAAPWRLVSLVWAMAWLVCCSTAQAAGREPLPAGSPQAALVLYQFAIYYADAPAASPKAALQRRLQNTPRAPAVVNELKTPPDKAVVLIDYITDAQTRYAPPPLDQIQRFGRGLSREQAVALQRSQHVLVMNFAHPLALSLPAYRLSLDLVEKLARETNGLLWDEETRELFTPDEWRKQRLETWDGGTPDVMKHITIHAYQGDKLVRAITLGMGKFALPDLVVEDFPWSSNRSMGNLINVLGQALVEGQVIGPKGQVDLDLRALRHAAVKQSHLGSLLANATTRAPLVLVKGVPEKGDPDNRLAEIRFDRAKGKDRYAQQDALLSAMWGSEDSISHIRHDEELLKASAAAKARLPSVRDTFNKGMNPGEYVMLKAPFKTSSGGNEWMWVEVTAWKGEDITGLLKNEPAEVPGLHAGQIVKVSQRDIFDYFYQFADGRREGNETGKIIERMQKR